MRFQISFARCEAETNLTDREYLNVYIDGGEQGLAADNHLTQSIEVALICGGIPEQVTLLLKCCYDDSLLRGSIWASPPTNS